MTTRFATYKNATPIDSFPGRCMKFDSIKLTFNDSKAPVERLLGNDESSLTIDIIMPFREARLLAVDTLYQLASAGDVASKKIVTEIQRIIQENNQRESK